MFCKDQKMYYFQEQKKKKKKSNEKAIKFKQACAGPRVWKVNILMEKHANFKSFERRDCAKNPLFQPLFSSFQSCSDSGN